MDHSSEITRKILPTWSHQHRSWEAGWTLPWPKDSHLQGDGASACGKVAGLCVQRHLYVVVCMGYHNEYQWLGGLKSIYFLTILGTGNPRSRYWWLLPKPFSLAQSWPPHPVSSHGLPSMHACFLMSSSYKDTRDIGLGPTLMTSF